MNISTERKHLRDASLGLLALAVYEVVRILTNITNGSLARETIEQGISQVGAEVPAGAAGMINGMVVVFMALASVGALFSLIIGLVGFFGHKNVQCFGLLKVMAIISLVLAIIGCISQLGELFSGKLVLDNIVETGVTVLRIIDLITFVVITKKIVRAEDAE